MLNIEKYKDEILKKYNKRLENTDEGRYSEQLANAIFDVFCHDRHRREMENVVEWAFREYEEPILTDEAKAYLKAIIEPAECTKISKHLSSSYTYELRIYDKVDYILIACSKDTKLYEYFKNMQDYKIYTPEELGLC